LIIDDGSTDNTEEVVKKYIRRDSRFSFHKRPENYASGGNGARNYGLSLAKGTYVNWLDSDDIFDSKKIELQLESLKTNQAKVSVCLGAFFNRAPGDCEWQLWSNHHISPNGVFDAMITQKMRWPSGAVLWQRDVLEDNCWETSLKGGQEWLFHIMQALRLNDTDVIFIDKILCYVRNSNTSITRKSSIVNRYSNYLNARVLLLEYLFVNHKNLFTKYFTYTYNFSLKYVKLLIENNRYNDLKYLSKLIKKTTFFNYIKFSFGVFIYKIFKKDYFLKQVQL